MVANLISRAIPFLSKYIPFNIASKALKKVDPRFGNFIEGAVGAGFTSNEIMDYLREKMGHSEREQLERKGGELRPDEGAALQQLKNKETPSKIAQGAIALGTGLGAGMLAANSSQQTTPTQQPQQTMGLTNPNGMGATGGLNASGFPPAPKQPQPAAQQQPSPQPQQAAQQPDVTEQLWDRVQQGKTKVSDPAVSEFLKMAHTLHKYRGLNDKAKFDELWSEFDSMRDGMPIKQLLDQLMLSYNKSLGNGNQQERGQQSQQQPPEMANLMAALQAAAQARQKRQGP